MDHMQLEENFPQVSAVPVQVENMAEELQQLKSFNGLVAVQGFAVDPTVWHWLSITHQAQPPFALLETQVEQLVYAWHEDSTWGALRPFEDVIVDVICDIREIVEIICATGMERFQFVHIVIEDLSAFLSLGARVNPPITLCERVKVVIIESGSRSRSIY